MVAVEVRVVEKLPLKIKAAEELLGMVRVPAVEVIVSPLMLVAVAAPKTGVTRVGEVEKTKRPEPVSLLITPANSAEVVAEKTLSLSVVEVYVLVSTDNVPLLPDVFKNPLLVKPEKVTVPEVVKF